MRAVKNFMDVSYTRKKTAKYKNSLRKHFRSVMLSDENTLNCFKKHAH